MAERIQHTLAQWLYNAELQRLRLVAPFLLALTSFAVLVSVAFYLVERPDDGVLWSPLTGKIERVDPAGPAVALLRPGDRIIGWDGTLLTQGTPFYADKRPGDQIAFSINRDGQEHIVTVTLAAPSISVVVARLEPLFVALVFWLIGVVVLAFKTSDDTARLFHWFNQVGCIVLTFGTLSTTGLLWASRLFSVLLWFLGPLTVHLHLQFPKATGIPRQRLFVAAIYGLAMLGSLYTMTSDADGSGFSSWPLSTYTLVRIYLIASFMVAVTLLGYAYRRATSSQVRQHIRLVVMGAALALIPLAAFALLPDALFGQPLIPYDAAFLFLLAIPLAYGYSIVRYQLIPLDRRISRSLVYIFLIILLALFYLLLYAGLSPLIPHELWHGPWITALLALIVAVTFVPLRDQLQKVIDWVFYGGWYDYRMVVQRMGRALDEVRDVPALVEVLVHNLQTTLRLKCACVLLRNREGDFSIRGGCPLCPEQQSSPLQVKVAGAVSEWLLRERRPVAGSLLRDRLTGASLTQDERRLLDCAQTRLWVPLVERDRLLGILVLGPKQGDDLFDGEDFEILDVVRRQASATIQNLSLLLELRQRAADMERLHQQLLRVREEERKRLARELHDEIIQALVGLNYDLSRFQIQETLSNDGQIERIQQQVHQVMGELRKVCSELRPPALDSLGLVSAVRSRLRELEAEGALQVRLYIDGDEEANIPEEIGVCSFRVLQEALINIQKHAGATQVIVHLAIRPTEICLSIQDNGRGFSAPTQLSQFIDTGHFGLIGARERLDLVGGKLTLRSAPGQGTCLEAQVPLPSSVPARASEVGL